ncbi:chromate efflux transporter [Salinimonas lutimaris]|uniref:chromate efflux transporter n=1 Tax=Salinimonas lutimaris TaxID=914153 RepID=UPI0010BFB404|nr:chromate efflux transporter [Salinimonas lutimaris]
MALSTPAPGAWSIFFIFLRLGLTSFGGPVAHLGFFRQEFVDRRRWLSDEGYADLVALCQFLPGPASSQVGLAIGLSRGGYTGALAAWAGFTLPSVIALIVFAMSLTAFGQGLPEGLLAGLKLAAVAVVAQAVWQMAQKLCPDSARRTLMVLAAALMLLFPSVWIQLAIIMAAALAGRALLPAASGDATDDLPVHTRRFTAVGAGAVLLLLLFGLPLVASSSHGLALIDTFYRAGSLVFGGGHVVLPLLQAEVVPAGWVDNHTFMAGYGAAQAVPGPLFTFAAFLGASMEQGIGGVYGGLLATFAIFLPSFLLVIAALPFWQLLRVKPGIRAALNGVNAAVVGLLLAALYDPVWTSAVYGPSDVVLVLLSFTALQIWRVPVWLVVLLTPLAGILLG